jgi:penicillin-binding protein 2
LVEHGGFGASAAAPLVRDVMTFLFDRPRAMAALAPLEEQWGGDIGTRLARRMREWEARPAGAVPPAAGG